MATLSADVTDTAEMLSSGPSSRIVPLLSPLGIDTTRGFSVFVSATPRDISGDEAGGGEADGDGVSAGGADDSASDRLLSSC